MRLLLACQLLSIPIADTGIVAMALLTAMKLATHIMLHACMEVHDIAVGGDDDDAATSSLKVKELLAFVLLRTGVRYAFLAAFFYATLQTYPIAQNF